MFYPAAKEVSEHLLDVFLSIFLRTGKGQAKFGEHEFDLGKHNIPKFTDQLTLRLAVKIKTQEDPGGTHDFNPSLCLVKNQLKEHVRSTQKWETPFKFDDVNERMRWNWRILSNGRLLLYVVDDAKPFCWRMSSVSTSRPRSQAARVLVA